MSDNLITNGSFLEDADSWKLTGTTYTPGEGYPLPGCLTMPLDGVAEQEVTIVAPGTYRASWYVFPPSSGSTPTRSFYFDVEDANGDRLFRAVYVWPGADLGWRLYTTEFSLLPGTYTLKWTNEGWNSTPFDTVRLEGVEVDLALVLIKELQKRRRDPQGLLHPESRYRDALNLAINDAPMGLWPTGLDMAVAELGTHWYLLEEEITQPFQVQRVRIRHIDENEQTLGRWAVIQGAAGGVYLYLDEPIWDRCQIRIEYRERPGFNAHDAGEETSLSIDTEWALCRAMSFLLMEASPTLEDPRQTERDLQHWDAKRQGREQEVRMRRRPTRGRTPRKYGVNLGCGLIPEEPAQPFADFSGTPVSGIAPTAVQFTANVTGEVTSYSWSFGDGGTSIEAGPSHTYQDPGAYDVSLTIVGPGGMDTETKPAYVNAYEQITAGFVYDDAEGTVPHTVQFTSIITGDYDTVLWDFGDGGSSSEEHPEYTYTRTGTYTVMMTVTGNGGIVMFSEVDLVVVTGAVAPVADFVANLLETVVGVTVYFNNLSTGTITDYDWDFGDTGESTDENPTHIYTTPGTYTVELYVTGPSGNDTEIKTDYILVIAAQDPRVTDALQVLYTFQEGSGADVLDRSEVGTAFDLVASGTYNRGDDYLEATAETVIKPTGDAAASKIISAAQGSNELTLETFIRPVTGGETWAKIASIISAATNDLNADIRMNSELNYANRIRTSSTGTEGVTVLATACTLDAIEHVVWTKDAGGTYKMYVDGVLEDTDTYAGDLSTWNAGYTLALMAKAAGGGHVLGRMYLFAAYSKALTLAEVQQNYTAGETWRKIIEEDPPDPPPPPPPPDPGDAQTTIGPDATAQVPPALTGDEYYIHPAGDDGNVGTRAEPWKTIGKANAALVDGEIVLIVEGTYNEQIKPIANNVTYRAYPGNTEPVLIAGQAGVSPIVKLGTSGVTLWGLEIKWGNPSILDDRWEWVQMDGNSGRMVDCTVYLDGDAWALYQAGHQEFGISVKGDDCEILDCEVYNLLFGITVRPECMRLRVSNCDVHNISGACLNVFQTDGRIRGLLIEHSKVGPCVTGDAVQFHEGADAGTYSLNNLGTIIRNCWLFAAGENAVDMKGAAHVVIENNFIFANIGSGNGPKDGWNRWAHQSISVGGARIAGNVIIRRNVIYDSCAGVEIQGNRYIMYHNTFVANNRDFTGPDSTASDSGEPIFTATKQRAARNNIVFKNNIAMGHNIAEVTLWLAGGSREIDYNQYYNAGGACVFAKQEADSFVEYGLADWKTQTSDEANSDEADPVLTDVDTDPIGYPDAHDFTLDTGSPCLNAGTHLTETVGSGSGTVVTVENADYFTDGYGITEGDRVKIGTNEPVRIIDVNYTTHRLTLESAIDWSDTDEVYKDSYLGAAPDIGAYEMEA